MKDLHEMRDLADQARAEVVSGVADRDTHQWLDGVEAALRWATGDGLADDIAGLVDRAKRAKVETSQPAAASVHMSPCSDCGTLVPTIATGHGVRDLPACPQSTSRHHPGHRVARTTFQAALDASLT